ncbi:peptidoglycan DD-metalloendopeptidase family protein [Bacillus cytotoxicus]|uniref:Peptidase M23B n=2 Tax=Bacillus cytotoxicus TaxID=580165 RepID=A0AAX2CFB3_9BACI|nr:MULTISPECIES: peptidoglycan DD-metalloendopeptidase family protein [Bacillus cereus group]ABS21525.1 peptidase M23B [Bacillus cytotoxicus NVH 391-98]AWC28167.1 peptidase M23 [Bacillus cytotoxicus]AWC32196.1 peptidase M23 [Bacillus cytotoxicus]AWC36225.1 peptidase M23 [Bacillus cytotoxicus]AWC40448.1 peptidase M23 [Bacillus cytotoxicus]
MKVFKIGIIITGLFFCSQLYVYADENQWTWPVDGRISDYFGTRHGKHYGIDIAAQVGTPVVAIRDGIVTKSYFSNSYGHVVFVKHGKYEAVYAHLNKRYVIQGDRVRNGEVIGEVGNTGESRGAHLHLEIHQGNWTIEKRNAMNPLLVLDEKWDQVVSSSLYVVQKGDTLVKIAHKFGTTVDKIKKKNALRQDQIYPNQRLYIN